MDRAQLKSLAKQQIKGNVGTMFLISILTTLLASLANLVPLVGSVASLLILTPAFSLAIISIYLNMANGQKAQVSDLFSRFNNFWAAFKVTFLVGLFTALWSMLFVIPGIIKAYSYSQAMYILAENPDIGALEAINRSKAMTNGKKMDLFVLDLSFIGWIILGSLTLGIAYIWIIPYISATKANVYNSIKNAAEAE